MATTLYVETTEFQDMRDRVLAMIEQRAEKQRDAAESIAEQESLVRSLETVPEQDLFAMTPSDFRTHREDLAAAKYELDRRKAYSESLKRLFPLNKSEYEEAAETVLDILAQIQERHNGELSTMRARAREIAAEERAALNDADALLLALETNCYGHWHLDQTRLFEPGVTNPRRTRERQTLTIIEAMKMCGEYPTWR